jgi:hypothetical protein
LAPAHNPVKPEPKSQSIKIRSTKSEIRNPKQIQNPNVQNSKQKNSIPGQRSLTQTMVKNGDRPEICPKNFMRFLYYNRLKPGLNKKVIL